MLSFTQSHRAPCNKTDANTMKPRSETFPTKSPQESSHRDSQGRTRLRMRHHLWPQHVLNGGAQCSPSISSQCLFYYYVQVKDCTGPLCHGLACRCCTHLFQAELRWNSVFVDVMGRRPLTWHQGHMPSFRLAPACLGSLFGGGAAVGSMNNDGKLKLSGESRLWTLAGDLGRKGKR